MSYSRAFTPENFVKSFPMKILYDMHVHSNFSVDAHDDILTMCQAAVEKGMKGICFTDHVDFHPADKGYDYFDYEQFSKVIEQARGTFGRQLDILKGIEFGEPHLYPQHFAQLADKPFDVIIGAVHRIGGQLVGEKEMVAHLTRKDIYSKYYSEVLKTVKFGSFDVLAHLDLPKRYIPPSISDLSIIEEILEAMIESGIVLEVNTSPLRRGGNESCPDRELLSRYIIKGGKRITIGSDAHSDKTIGKGFTYVQRQLLRGMEVQVGVFWNRRFIDLPVY